MSKQIYCAPSSLWCSALVEYASVTQTEEASAIMQIASLDTNN